MHVFAQNSRLVGLQGIVNSIKRNITKLKNCLIYFFEFKRLIYKSYRRDIKDEDVWDMDEERAAANVVKDFETRWNKLIEK